MKVYIVNGGYDYEGERIVGVFADEGMANDLVARCVAYDKTKPEWPDDESESAYLKYDAKMVRWEKKHPLKMRYPFSYYEVIAQDLIPAVAK